MQILNATLQILERVGLPASLLSSDAGSPTLSAWGEAELHGLVAAFLAARFPILLALNKVGGCNVTG